MNYKEYLDLIDKISIEDFKEMRLFEILTFNMVTEMIRWYVTNLIENTSETYLKNHVLEYSFSLEKLSEVRKILKKHILNGNIKCLSERVEVLEEDE